MEQGPEQFRPLGPFRLEFDTGFEIICTPDNTSAFIHSEEPQYDHLFILTTSQETGEPERGDYVFREQVGNFDEIVLRMDASDWTVIESEDGKAIEDDVEAYEEFQALKQRNIRLREAARNAIRLTDRQERLVGFLNHILDKENLIADDFKGTGDLFI